jgi:hypothetical protein
VRTIIAGSRTVTDYAVVCGAIESAGFHITEVVSGTARGVDRMGERWATGHGVSVKRFPADWSQYGRRAGYLRNRQMAVYASEDPSGPGQLIAIQKDNSRGTGHMIDLAREAGLRVYVLTV